MKYLITWNNEEVVSVLQYSGGNVVTGTNVMITTLDNALNALNALGVDCTRVIDKINEDL